MAARVPTGIKLFIGQVPKEYEEKDVRDLFEPFGDIYDFNFLLDKESGHHKGCCFLTFYDNESSKAAIESLHGRTTLPGARNPIQVKAAASETPENRKLFVGMLSRSLDEEAVRSMFSEYGNIEDIRVVRNGGTSKGCAFVLFETRQQAMNAIKNMHHSQTMDGCSAPMVVKLADNEKDKMAKKMSSGFAAPSPGVASNYSSMVGAPSGIASGDTVSQLQQQAVFYQQLFNQLVLPQIMAGNLPQPGQPGAVTALVNAMAAQAQTLDQQSSSGSVNNTLPAQLPQYGVLPQSSYTPYNSTPQPKTQLTSDGKQKEGPDGANLFIYHIPYEYGDGDLTQLFATFGNVLSAKVFRDPITQDSKGFGFVSYDSASSAESAINSMNGYVIRDRRLRVSLKKKKDAKPY